MPVEGIGRSSSPLARKAFLLLDEGPCDDSGRPRDSPTADTPTVVAVAQSYMANYRSASMSCHGKGEAIARELVGLKQICPAPS